MNENSIPTHLVKRKEEMLWEIAKHSHTTALAKSTYVSEWLQVNRSYAVQVLETAGSISLFSVTSLNYLHIFIGFTIVQQTHGVLLNCKRTGSILMNHVIEELFEGNCSSLKMHIVASWLFIPHEHPHRGCQCCNVDILYSRLEELGGNQLLFFPPTPKTEKGCLMAAMANLCHSDQDWLLLLF